MKIIKPSVKLWHNNNNEEHIVRCAKICYAKENITNVEQFINTLIDKKHLSMFRHGSIYYKIPIIHYESGLDIYIENNPYFSTEYKDDFIYCSTNLQYIKQHEDVKLLLDIYEISFTECFSNKFSREVCRYTFNIVTQISTTRELNRVSPNNIAEQSTRYVNLKGKGSICEPYWFNFNTDSECEYEFDGVDHFITQFGKTNAIGNSNFSMEPRIHFGLLTTYLNSCYKSFNDYEVLLNSGMLPQDARGVLPMDTASVAAYTYSIKEWRNILDLRYYGTTGKPHPNAKIIASMIRDHLIKLGYKFK